MVKKLAWDRVLETCVRNDGEAIVLVPGAEPLLRVWNGLRALQVPPLEREQLSTLLGEIYPSEHEERSTEFGHLAFDLRYGSDYQFRVAVFGGRPPAAMLLARVPRGTRAIAGDREPGAAPADFPPLSSRQILDICIESGAFDVLLAPGCPPLLRSDRGLHAFRTHPLSAERVDDIARSFQVPGFTEEKDGYRGFDFRFSATHWFRAAVFGDVLPSFAMFMAQRY
jgi:Tfp pilus assembly pilus retraction ATPase PilT